MSPASQLPDALPVLPGAALSGRYLVGDESSYTCGDTLDALPLPGGRVALFVVDVVGGGQAAEIAAGHARTILRERLGAGAGVAETLASADRYAHAEPELCAATVCVATFGLADGILEWATAGHPPPLRMGPSGAPQFLASSGSAPLGCTSRGAGRHPTHTTRLEPGDMVGLYTDGLLTLGGGSLVEGQRRLVDAARSALRDPQPASADSVPAMSQAQHGDDVCDRVLRGLITAQGVGDDVALLVLTRTRRPEAFASRTDASPEILPVLRHRINAWLDGAGAGLTDHVGLGHAVVELAANVIEHAYVDRPRPPEDAITVDAQLHDDGTVQVEVRDQGRWRPQTSSGRGLAMVSGLVEAMRIERSPHGTSVELTHLLTRPVPLLRAIPEPADRMVVDDSRELRMKAEPGHLTVSGAVDALSEELFHAALTEATCAGTIDTVVDLDDVTHLASPGVQTLYEFVRRTRHTRTSLALRARPDSPAAQILQLVGLEATWEN